MKISNIIEAVAAAKRELNKMERDTYGSNIDQYVRDSIFRVDDLLDLIAAELNYENH